MVAAGVWIFRCLLRKRILETGAHPPSEARLRLIVADLITYATLNDNPDHGQNRDSISPKIFVSKDIILNQTLRQIGSGRKIKSAFTCKFYG